jgi:hypothetical protein
MGNRVALVLAACSTALIGGVAASGQETTTTTTITTTTTTPAYANVEVVSVDAATRLVVVKTSTGAEETLQLDDGLAGAPGVKAGDRVMMTVRGEPGRKRVSAITKVTGKPLPTPTPANTYSELGRVEMRARYANEVASLSEKARTTDGVWSSFVTACDAKLNSSVDGGRDWFGLWDGRVKADLSGGSCRDMFNQIVTSGEGIKKAMASAEDVVRKTMEPGELRDIRRLHSMEWDGWSLPAPDKLEP